MEASQASEGGSIPLARSNLHQQIGAFHAANNERSEAVSRMKGSAEERSDVVLARSTRLRPKVCISRNAY